MILSIITFVIFAFFMSTLFRFADNAEKRGELSSSKKNIFLAMLIYSIMGGIRYKYGGDCESYALGYEQTEKYGYFIAGDGSTEKPEYLFKWLTEISAFLGIGRITYLGLLSFLGIFFIVGAFKNRKSFLPLLGGLLIMGPLYYHLNAAVRQMITACIFLYSTSILIDYRKYAKYILLVLVGVGFHTSGLLLMPLVFIYKYDRMPNRWFCLFLYIMCIFVGNMSFIANYTNQIQYVMTLMGYSGYSEYIENYVELEATITSYGPRQIVILFFNFIIILFSKRVDSYFNGEQFWRVSFLYFMIYICMTEMLRSANGLFTRPLMYFSPFVLVCTVYLISYLKRANMPLVYWCTLAIAGSFNILMSIADVFDPEGTGTFRFIFLR